MNQYFIKITKRITSEFVYTDLSERIIDFYKTNLPQIIIDMSETPFIEPSSLPLLLSLGFQVMNEVGVQVKLEFGNNVRIINFLFFSGFFTYGSRFYEINPDILGGINDPKIRTLNKKYKIGRFDYEVIYQYLSDPEREREFRNRVFAIVRYEIVKKYAFTEIVKELFSEEERRKPSLNKQFSSVINYLVEIITNAIIHSESVSFIYGQTLFDNKENTIRKTSFSVSDSGIGFTQSLLNKNWIIKYPKKTYQNDIHFEDLISILNVVEYSYQFKGKRDNLWEVMNFYIQNNGEVRIHQNQTQVIFSCETCLNCEKLSIDNCADCFLKHDNNKNFRKFQLPIEGVHIELELRRNTNYIA